MPIFKEVKRLYNDYASNEIKVKATNQFINTATKVTKEPVAKLEVNFDFESKKSIVKNELGVSVNQPKLTYNEYIDNAYDCVDRAASNEFQDIESLKESINNFLECISLDNTRYEAYFGLGYVYSLVRDFNNSLYFLDIAYQISGGHDLILEFSENIKKSIELDS